jgi:hypothetical protein
MTAATKALDTQLDLIRFLESERGGFALHRFNQTYNKHTPLYVKSGTGGAAADEAEQIAELRYQILQQVGHGETFYVSAAMTDLVQQAAEALGPEKLHSTDLFAPRAFILFDRDIPYRVGEGVEVDHEVLDLSLRALSWAAADTVGRRDLAGNWQPDAGLVFTAWVASDSPTMTSLLRSEGQERNNLRAMSPLMPLEMSAWAFGDEWKIGVPSQDQLHQVSEQIDALDPDGPDEPFDAGLSVITDKLHEFDRTVWPQIAHLRRLVLAINRLMWQKVAVVRDDRAQRPAVRRAERVKSYQAPDYGVVRTIHLRREYDALDRLSAADRDEVLSDGPWWTHRWVVRGHWRNQWYPTLHDHRQVFIAPYVKGPADRPLIVKDKLYVVDR